MIPLVTREGSFVGVLTVLKILPLFVVGAAASWVILTRGRDVGVAR